MDQAALQQLRSTPLFSALTEEQWKCIPPGEVIDNAIYAVNGIGKICIGTSLEANQLVVEIVDDGSGIPSDVQSHLFEPFFTTKPVGTFTGQIISNRIVGDRHGGEIEFESHPGETRFKVRLPVRNFLRPENMKGREEEKQP